MTRNLLIQDHPISKLLRAAPSEGEYQRTAEIAKFIGRYDDEWLLAQKWMSPYSTNPDVWVIIPTYLLH